MQSIQFNLVRAAKTLAGSSETAALDAEILLSHTLAKDRSYLRAWPEQTLVPEQLEVFDKYIEQRLQGLPIAYIVGYREFWSRKFDVNPSVLIPRHETELLVELSLKRIPRNTALKILDLGTGSGIIAITLAAERPKTEVFACDISEAALATARQNAKKLQTSRIRFFQSNWFDNLPDTHFDFIISNPPYVDSQDQHLQQGDLRFEPPTALVAQHGGLEFLSHIIEQSPKHLNNHGYLIVEHGYDQKNQVKNLFLQHGFQHVESFIDLSGNPRVSSGQWIMPHAQLENLHSTPEINTPHEVVLPRKLIQQILASAQSSPNYEVCGLISSLNNVPHHYYPINNVADYPQTRFLLDTKQQITTLTQMREHGESLFAIFHSHPSAPAIPSKSDVHLAAYPEALHLIASLQTKGVLELRCFKISNNLTQELPLILID